MSVVKQNMTGTVMSVVELIIGILLLINPVGFTSGIIIAVGVILMICGLVNVVKYFRAEPEEAAIRQLLAKGLGTLLVGAFCAFRARWFVDTFPVLTLVYGVAILFVGLLKIQWTVDMVRQKRDKWFLVLISAVLSVVCGILTVAAPFRTVEVLWLLAGISLIVEAVFDIVAAVLENKSRS